MQIGIGETVCELERVGEVKEDMYWKRKWKDRCIKRSKSTLIDMKVMWGYSTVYSGESRER